jgi:hypothetical protein
MNAIKFSTLQPFSTNKNTMYRKTLLAIVLIPVASTAFSQTMPKEPIPDVTDIPKVMLYPGFSYEKRIGRHQTLYGKVFPAINLTFEAWDGIGGSDWEASLYFDPTLYLQYRFYYNGRKRQAKGKRTELNSMNYIGIIDRTILTKHPINNNYDKEKHYRTVNSLGMVWGLQRNFHSRVSIDLNVGPAITWARTTETSAGYTRTENVSAVSILTQFDVGFWLNKRK